MPTVTTASTPDTLAAWAGKYAKYPDRSAMAISVGEWSSRRRICRRRKPTPRPMATPPTTSTGKRQAACQKEKCPVITAVTAKAYATSAVASLIRLSPSRMATSLRGTPSLEAMAVAATASVGATIAPITKQVGHDRPEMPA